MSCPPLIRCVTTQTFNPRRFLDLRKSSPGSDQYQFASASKDMMAFGFGHSTCPGRFFAGNEIKLILANLVQNYDFKVRATVE